MYQKDHDASMGFGCGDKKQMGKKSGDTHEGRLHALLLPTKLVESDIFENHIVILELPTGLGRIRPTCRLRTQFSRLREYVVRLLGDKRTEGCVTFLRKLDVTQSIVRIGHRCNKLTVVEEINEGASNGFVTDSNGSTAFGDSVEDRVDGSESWMRSA